MFGVQYFAIESNLTPTVFSRKSPAFGDILETVPWLEAVCNICL